MITDSSDASHLSISDAPIEVGRSGKSGIRLHHPTVSRHHARIQWQTDHLVIEDLGSQYGTYVNDSRIRCGEAHVGDRVRFGATVTYRVRVRSLTLDGTARGIALQCTGLSLRRSDTDIVQNVTLTIPADSFIGILGPSGCGKSTLLNCIASYSDPHRGQIIFDGDHNVAALRDEYRALLGHVPQENIYYSALTVRQNLWYAARLRLGHHVEDHHIQEAIEGAGKLVDLTEKLDRPYAGELSGGQKKRLCVAVELLRRPRLLLLDEPTSGLDPASEAGVMERLRHIAAQGTTVVCTTHLMENVRLFDRVVILGLKNRVGQVAYDGSPDEICEHFGGRNFADVFEKLERGQFEAHFSDGSNSSAVVPMNAATVQTPTPSTGDRRVRTDATPLGERTSPSLKQLAIAAIDDPTVRQAVTVFQRGCHLLWRDRGLVTLMAAQPVLLGTLVCLTQFDALRTESLYLLSSVIAIWLGLNNSARDLVRDRKNYVRERLAGLQPLAYLSAKMSVFLVAGLAQVIVLLVTLRLSSSLILQFEPTRNALESISWIWWGIVLMASYSGGLGLGFLASTLARTEESAVAALPLLILPQLLLSAVAVGQVDKSYDDSRVLRPLIVTIQTPAAPVKDPQSRLSRPAVATDLLSLLCYSRPASLIVGPVAVKGFSRWIWVGDLCHLVILLAATWLAVYVVFSWREVRWPQLIGL